MMRYAFLLMGPFDSSTDRAIIKDDYTIIGVSSIKDAEARAKELLKEGVLAIELCGAFGEEGAKRIIEATNHSIAVGFVTHFPEDDKLFEKAFG